MKFLRPLFYKLGYDLRPLKKHKNIHSQLVASMKYHNIDCVLDVGANLGQYAYLLREYHYDGPIISFEPIPHLNDRLQGLAPKDPNWKIYPTCALGEKNERSKIFLSEQSDMSSLLPGTDLLLEICPDSKVAKEIEIDVRRLDSLSMIKALPHQRMFLKMDVQGFEPQVLRGAEGLLQRIHGIQLEMALVPIYEGEVTWKEMVKTIESLGFELCVLIPGYYERKEGRQIQVDGVFYRRSSN